MDLFYDRLDLIFACSRFSRANAYASNIRLNSAVVYSEYALIV